MKKRRIIIISSIVILLLAISTFLICKSILKQNNSESRVSETEDTLCRNFKDELIMSIGDNTPSESDFIECDMPVSIDIYYQGEIYESDTLDYSGRYEVKLFLDDTEYTSYILVEDKSIELVLKELTIEEGTTYDINSFVTSCHAPSGSPCEYTYKIEEMGLYDSAGTYEITITASTSSGETGYNSTTLTIEKSAKTNDKDDTSNKPSSNQGSTTTTPSKENSSTSPTITKTEQETDTSSEVGKYGVTVITKTVITYNVYSDGSRVEKTRKTTTSYDKSTYNATTSDLKSEASSLTSSNSSIINEVLSYVNSYREEAGVSPLTLDSGLTLAAEIRSLEQGWSTTGMSHTRPDGSSFFTVLTDLGYPIGISGENVAYGYKTASSVSNAWKNSSGHYANMVSSSYTKIGIGLAVIDGTYYWTQLFTS